MRGNSKMRIGVVCYPSQGGSGIVATELGKRLAGRGHEVHFISYQLPYRLNQNRMPRLTKFHLVDVPSYPLFDYPPVTPAVASKIMSVVKEHRLNLIHAHYAVPHAIAAVLAKEMLMEETGKETKVVATLHGTDVTVVGSMEAYKSAIAFSLRKSDGVTAVCQYLGSSAADLFGLEREQVKVIYNFIDCSRFKRRENLRLRARYAKPNERIICHMSNFRPIKRVGDVILAFRLIQGEIPAKLLLIGNGPEVEAAKEMAANLGLQGKVHFIGNSPQVHTNLALADLFLLPSQSEGHSLAILEAMACEVPVIATKVGGIPEVVVEGKTGFLVEVGDINLIAERGVEILKDPGMGKKMGEEARELVKNNFSPRIIVDQYERYYRKILGLSSGSERRRK